MHNMSFPVEENPPPTGIVHLAHRTFCVDNARTSTFKVLKPKLFIHSGYYFYSTSSCPLLFRGAPNTAWILCRSFMPKRYRQLRVKDLLKIPTWQPEWDSTPLSKGDRSTNEQPCPFLGK